jgi:hypothetical protein
MSVAAKLPNELLREILLPVYDVPDELFHDISDISPFSRLDRISTARYVPVCKAWLPVTTSLLYRVVILRSKAQANSLERTLRAKKEYGQFIRKLRVEGGYGDAMRKILLVSKNITDLFLSIELAASDSSKGLCASISTLNPACLTIWESSHNRTNNASSRMLGAEIAVCIEKHWKELVSHNSFYQFHWELTDPDTHQYMYVILDPNQKFPSRDWDGIDKSHQVTFAKPPDTKEYWRVARNSWGSHHHSNHHP